LDSALEFQSPKGEDSPSRAHSVLVNECDTEADTETGTASADKLTDLELEFLETFTETTSKQIKNTFVNTFKSNAHSVTYSAKADKPGWLVLDLGCRRNVAGPKWHSAMRKVLARSGLKPERLPKTEKFRFGDDRVEESLCAWRYPIGIEKHNGYLDIAEVRCNCPGLMSDNTMQGLKIGIETGDQTYSVRRYNLNNRKMIKDQSGHAILSVVEFGDLGWFPVKYRTKTVSFGDDTTQINIHTRTAKQLTKNINTLKEVFVPDKSGEEFQDSTNPQPISSAVVPPVAPQTVSMSSTLVTSYDDFWAKKRSARWVRIDRPLTLFRLH
jgi:hypothetical protein